MESLIQNYGGLGIGLIVLFQMFNIQARLIGLEIKLESFVNRLNKIEEKDKK